jgi:hypothetical protein
MGPSAIREWRATLPHYPTEADIRPFSSPGPSRLPPLAPPSSKKAEMLKQIDNDVFDSDDEEEREGPRFTENIVNPHINDAMADPGDPEIPPPKHSPYEYTAPESRHFPSEITAPIGQILMQEITQMSQLVQQIDDLVVGFRPIMNSFNDNQIAYFTECYQYLEDAIGKGSDSIQFPRADIDAFKGMKAITSFSTGAIDVFKTNLEKLMFDILILIKSYRQNYPQISSTQLFHPNWDAEQGGDIEPVEEEEAEEESVGEPLGEFDLELDELMQGLEERGEREERRDVIPEGEEVVGHGRSHFRRHENRGNVLVNFYGEVIGKGSSVPSIWRGNLRNCTHKYLL